MVDSIDFSTLDLTAEFAAEKELSQLDSSQHGYYEDDTQHSTEIETFDNNYELSFLSQRSASPSQLSTHSSQSQHKQCINCGSHDTLQLDNHTGHKICTKCSHIVEDFENMQNEEIFVDEDDDQIAEQQHDILKEHQKHKYCALNKEIIRFQDEYSELILNAFQCVLQSQTSVLIHEYNVKPHLYSIMGQIWCRFLNKMWIKKGFGSKHNEESQWIWKKNECKLYQNNDAKQEWMKPKQSVIDVFMSTEDETDTTSSEDDMDDDDDDDDDIDLDSLIPQSDCKWISMNKKNKKRYRKSILTEKEKKKLNKRMRLKRKQVLPMERARFTQRIPNYDGFGWKKVKQRYDARNENSHNRNRVLYGAGEIDLELSLVLLYIALRVCGEVWTMNDVINGAQKGVIPYLRAFESLPLRFRIKDGKQRRKLYGSDDNYISFRKLFIRNQIKYEIAQFYHISHRLIIDLNVTHKIVPFNNKLMVIKYLRDLHIPLAIYSIVKLFITKYKSFQSIFSNNDNEKEILDMKWKELSEYKSQFVHYTNNSKVRDPFDVSMKLIFTNGIDQGMDGEYTHLTQVTIMTLIIIAILSVYRLDKTLKHKLNENPLFKTLPPLSQWFDFSLKHKYMDHDRLCDIPQMFGYDTMNKENENLSWIFGLTKDFILRHYAVKPHCALIQKFIERKSKRITKKYKNIEKEKREKKRQNLNEYKSFNSLHSIVDDDDDDNNAFEYNGYHSKQSNYSVLYLELMLLCCSRIGLTFDDLQQRLEEVMMKVKIVFEYDEIMAQHPSDAIATPVNRWMTKECRYCGTRSSVKHLVQCHFNCDARICRPCLMRLVNDEEMVTELLMKEECGILKARKWKCFECESGEQLQHKIKRKRKKVYVRTKHTQQSFECKYCERGFSRKYNLNVHIATIHDHSLRRFQCEKCLLKFATNTLRKRHTRKCTV